MQWKQPIRSPYSVGRKPSKHSAQGLKGASANVTREGGTGLRATWEGAIIEEPDAIGIAANRAAA